MYNQYNLASDDQADLVNLFIKFLNQKKLSSNSIRFYKSDINHFVNWLKMEIRSLGVFADSFNDTLPFIRKSHAESYRNYLIQKKVNPKTLNRKLSSLRQFADFLYDKGATSFNLFEGVSNLNSTSKLSPVFPKIVSEFEAYLQKEKASLNTMKNYLADVKHFLNWINRQNG